MPSGVRARIVLKCNAIGHVVANMSSQPSLLWLTYVSILRLRTTLTLKLKDTTWDSPCGLLNAEVVPRKETQAIWHWKGRYACTTYPLSTGSSIRMNSAWVPNLCQSHSSDPRNCRPSETRRASQSRGNRAGVRSCYQSEIRR
jgi:hypothetical protein